MINSNGPILAFLNRWAHGLLYIHSYTHVTHQTIDGQTVGPVHYATHDTRLTHGHRILRLAVDFEMLRVSPDFVSSAGWFCKL